MFYERVFKKLNEEKVEYLVIGGVAVNLLGYNRVTGDLDIIIALENENVSRYIKAVKKLKMIPRVPVKLEDFAREGKRKSWIKKKEMKVFSVYNPEYELEHIDVLIDSPVNFRGAYKRREIIKDGDLKVPAISLPDLIKMKEVSGRERDLIDLKALRKIKDLRKDAKTSQ